MAQRLGGPGLGLPPPQNLFPTELFQTPYDWSGNEISLQPGDSIVIPPGDWIVDEGSVTLAQWLDPVTGIWRGFGTKRGGFKTYFSDGVNLRLANLTGCPIAATIAGGGTNFTQATATITANVGGSTWQPIVGGSLTVTTISNAGAGYTMPPLLQIPHPPLGLGVQATGVAILTGTSVTSVSLINVGAGYTASTTSVVLLANQADPNFGAITNATVVLGLTNAGKITAALCTNNGASLATISALTLTAAGGAGSGATITPNVLQAATGISITTAGGGYSGANLVFSTGGGATSVSAIGNPSTELGPGGFITREAQFLLATAAGVITSVSQTMDPGLFISQPSPVIVNGAGIAATTSAVIAFTMGGLSDSIKLQPASG